MECKILCASRELPLRIVLDRNSVEVFINGGEQAMTTAIYTPLDADGISFSADGSASADVEKFSLKM